MPGHGHAIIPSLPALRLGLQKTDDGCHPVEYLLHSYHIRYTCGKAVTLRRIRFLATKRR